MNSPHETMPLPPPLDLSRWRKLPALLMAVGGVLSLIGLIASPEEFGYSWLTAFMFYLTLALGALFLTMVHHLADAGWSVAIRRFCEHLGALLFPWLAILFVPVVLLAPKIYQWLTLNPAEDRALRAKLPLFTLPGFILTSAGIFAVWWLLTNRLRAWSLKQDETGDLHCTRKMRFHSGWGILAFAATVTLAPILWMKSLQYQWSSTIYGLYIFACCGWMALATAYVLARLLQRQRLLTDVLRDHQFYFLGVLFFAFTLLQAYFEFAQYFVVWNGNIPEETFWYLLRERGSWWWICLALIFGHFFAPFILLLPARVKVNFKIMLPVCAGAWLMNYADLAFNILPALPQNQHGYPFQWIWLQFGCVAFMGGVLAWAFLKNFNAHAPYPRRDPRLHEAMGLQLEPEEFPDTFPEERTP
ncbi:MAG TPA: hypothetical protein VFB55_02130 [Verrucomicrobiae bacterium]|nr:hypothetical protein [Verrucomicrobiae bacterium]